MHTCIRSLWFVVEGIYVLIIRLCRTADVAVGKLGTIRFSKGLYAYVGSAQVALEKRIERHLRKDKRLFWHIDYLLQNPSVEIAKIFVVLASKQEECKVATEIALRGKAVRDFGCSDCRCKSHLYFVEDYGFLVGIMREIPVPSPSTFS